MIDRPIGEEELRPIGEEVGVEPAQTTESSLERDLNNFLITRDENATTESAYARLSSMSVDRLIETSLYSEDVQEDRRQRQVADMQNKLQDVINYPDLAYDYLLASADPDVDINDFRYNVNTQIGLDVVRRLREQEAASGGVVDAVIDFGDFMLRESTVAIPANLTRRSEELGRELAQRRLTMRPSEFKTWVEGYAMEAMERGLRDENAWNIDALENELMNNGYDPFAGVNQAFALLDLTALASGGVKLARAASRAATTIGRTAITEGVEEATEVATTRLSRVVEEETLADAGPQSLSANRNEVGISQSAYSRIMENNRIVRQVQDLYRSGTFGRVADESVIATKADEVIERVTNEFKARVATPIYQTSRILTDDLGNYFFNIDVGTSKGMPFKATPNGEIPANVQAKAKQLGGVAEFVDPENVDSGIVIRMRNNVDTNKLIDQIDIFELENIETNAFLKIANNPITSSSTARGVEALSTAAQRAEAGASKLLSVFSDEAKKIDRLSATERSRLSFITQLRDGSGTAARREWYNSEEFVKEYSARYGEQPTQRLVEAYDATVTISDAAWILKDTNIFKQYVAAGYKSIDTGSGVFRPAKEVPSGTVPANARVLDMEYNANLLKSELRGEDVVYFKLDRAMDDGTQYVVNPQAVKEVDPFDVFGYNAGGPRVNPQARYFVLTGKGNRLKTLLSTRTEREARLARNQIENIRQAQNSGDLTDDIIRANNDWNPEIQTVEQFDEFAATHRWKLTDEFPVAYKQRDGAVIDEALGDGSIEERMSLFDFAQTDARRNDTVLPSYGGGASYNVDTVTSVQQQFASVANKFAFNVYTQKAMVGWVETARKYAATGLVKFPDNVHPNDYRNLFLRAEITGNDKISARLREIRNIERRRMGIDSEIGQAMTHFGERVAEYVFDLGENKVARALGVRSDFVQNTIMEPSSALLRVGFATAFGFFNFSQLLVQSIHAVAIAGISKQGIKGASMAFTLRSLYHQSPEAIEEGLKRAARQYGYTPEKMREIYNYIRTSGRDVIEGEAVELGTGAEFGISSFKGQGYDLSTLDRTLYNTTRFGRKAMDKGLSFYRAGERASRMTGAYTAIAEYIQKFPTRALDSEHARNWITRRDQDLTFNMTTASRGFGQSGVMRVPTQWLSYNLRAMETIFVGRGFTRGERARLAGMLTAFYGLSGFGAERAAEEIAEMFGIQQDSAVFTTLKWGVIDGIMDALLPEGEGEGRVGTGLATRLSVVQGMKQLYNDVTQGKFLEIVGGPSGQIGGSLVQSFVNVFGSLASGQPYTLTEDVMQLIRQPSGLDNIAKAIGIFNNGLYVSKTGVPIPTQMTPTEGILALFGIGSLKQTEWYTTQTQVFADERQLSTFRREMNRRSEVAYRYLQSDNENEVRRGLELLAEIDAQIAFSGFSPQQQQSLRRSVANQDEEQFNRTIQRLLRYDMQAAGRLESVLR